MTFVRNRLSARKAVAIVVFIALTANQWISLFRFHSRDHSFGQSEFDPPPGQTKYNVSLTDTKNLKIPEIEVVNEIIHRAFFGLGHRFHRSAAVYHLAQSLSSPQIWELSTSTYNSTSIDQIQHQPYITHFRFQWESCLSSDEIQNATIGDDNGGGKKEYNVFRYLFGDDIWKLNDWKDGVVRPSQTHEISSIESHGYKSATGDVKARLIRNMLVLRNDVPGYIAGQLYKDLKLPVSYNLVNWTDSNTSKSILSLPTSTTSSNHYKVILDKLMRSDVDFYRRLEDNYEFKKEIREFQDKHKWNERPLVIGLHLRTGNGEDEHFAESGRASSLDIDESTMISRLLRLTMMAVDQEMKHFGDETPGLEQRWQGHGENSALRPLLFVATDTAHLVPMIENMMNSGTMKDENRLTPSTGTLEVLTWPQDRLPKNAGVSFDALQGKGDRCLHGWRSAMSDSLLLSKTDILIAAKRSTFTQSLPMTLGFDRNRNKNSYDRILSVAKDGKIRSRFDDSRSKEKKVGRFAFCEVNETSSIDMTCFADARSWLFRGKDDPKYPSNEDVGERIWSFSIADATSGAHDRQHSNELVEHKVTVLLPDVDLSSEFQPAIEFLRRENVIALKPSAFDSDELHESVFRYGRSKIYKKYRNSHETSSKTDSGWNLVFNVNP
eukprot:CAMPEP_0116145592 /NCGR_PEP_ID=MMETSP0329-20121206/16682_1 /TAXON_ID=697910 /ORGANISM="Pseudo-nitzschia arenysensis, Strain B593" /LENGTH=664 /DNA_ID=CAMNT_0003641221 /DNA_START=34 /DNA_END=2028 /DNA_ORIENTATION=+